MTPGQIRRLVATFAAALGVAATLGQSSNGAAPIGVAASAAPSPETAASLSGTASWYCNADASRGPRSRCTQGHPDGAGEQLYAAVPDSYGLRGEFVTVCSASACVDVEVIDCNCGPGANLVDLYADAFERIAPLSRGRVAVTLTTGASATLPPTDAR